MKKALGVLKAYSLLVIGCLVYSLAWTQIYVPNGLVSGGITGLSSVIQYGTGFPIAMSYGLMNLALLIVAFIVLGRAFGIRTIFSLAVITLMLDFLPLLNLPPLVLKDTLLSPVIASFMEAIGISIMINNGGSSGGTDIIALIVSKFTPVRMGRVYMVIDIAIIASVMLVPGKTVDDMIYGYIAVIVFSLSLDYILLGRKSSVQVIIFSDKYDDIAEFITKDMERGVTALNAVGWYSQTDKKVLLLLIRKRELSTLTEHIKKIDPKAFVSIASVASVYGEGFEEIKVGFKFRKNRKLSDNVSGNTTQQ